MKRIVSLLLICCLFLSNSMGCSKKTKVELAKVPVVQATNSSSETVYKAPKQSQQELYQDVFVTLLDPYIQKALDDYYGQLLAISPMYTPEYVEILNVERPMGYRSFSYIITLQVEPYVGPHESIGIDRLTIRVGSGEGEVKVEKFEHIKSYEKDRNFSYGDELTFYKNDEKSNINPTAISVVTKSLEATKTNDYDTWLSTFTTDRQKGFSRDANGKFGVISLDILSIHYVTDTRYKHNILKSERAIAKGLTADNIAVISALYEAKYDSTRVPSSFGDFDWHYVLLREDKISPWLIQEWGYGFGGI